MSTAERRDSGVETTTRKTGKSQQSDGEHRDSAQLRNHPSADSKLPHGKEGRQRRKQSRSTAGNKNSPARKLAIDKRIRDRYPAAQILAQTITELLAVRELLADFAPNFEAIPAPEKNDELVKTLNELIAHLESVCPMCICETCLGIDAHGCGKCGGRGLLTVAQSRASVQGRGSR